MEAFLSAWSEAVLEAAEAKKLDESRADWFVFVPKEPQTLMMEQGVLCLEFGG